MENGSKKWIVAFIGPPGCGKDTQAELLATELGLVHIKTSKLIQTKLKTGDPADPVIAEEQKKFSAGELSGREFVNALIEEAVHKVHEEGKGIVFSGSPRELAEGQELMPLLDTLYGRENIKVVNIKVSPEESLKRNSHRRICEANQHPIPDLEEYVGITVCPHDGSPIITRELDDPGIIKHRYEVYQNQTEPLIDFLVEKGYNMITIDGAPSIEEVHRDILNKLW